MVSRGLFLLPLLGCGFGKGHDTCFVAGVRIWTPDGPRLIEDLKVGDVVLSYSLSEQRVVERPIVRLLQSTADGVVRLTSGDAAIAGVTLSHPFFDATSGDFRPLSALTTDSRLLHQSGEDMIPLPIAETVPVPGEVTVYNLSIGGTEQNYFAEGILVHNKSIDEYDDTIAPLSVSVA